jgi:hypothetical protein
LAWLFSFSNGKPLSPTCSDELCTPHVYPLCLFVTGVGLKSRAFPRSHFSRLSFQRRRKEVEGRLASKRPTQQRALQRVYRPLTEGGVSVLEAGRGGWPRYWELEGKTAHTGSGSRSVKPKHNKLPPWGVSSLLDSNEGRRKQRRREERRGIRGEKIVKRRT